MYMRCFLLFTAFTCSLLAQSTPTDVFSKAPPQVDEALRASVTLFYQAHVDGKFRKAEEVVAPDSHDIFYEMEKQRYISFEISSIAYSDEFTKAKVITAVEMDWRNPRVGVMRVKPPLASMWRLENGKWLWYTVARKDWDTPFGKMTPGPDVPRKIETFKHVTPGEVLAQVRASKGTVSLSSFEKSQDVVEVKNGMPGNISLRLDGVTMPGLEMKIDKPVLKSGEAANVTFNYAPETKNPKGAIIVDLHVQPTGQVIPLRVQFAVPAEVMEQLKRVR